MCGNIKEDEDHAAEGGIDVLRKINSCFNLLNEYVFNSYILSSGPSL